MNKMKYTYRTNLAKCLFAAALMTVTVSCVEYLDAPVPAISDGEKVQVELSIGFADEEEGFDFSGTTRASGTMAEAQNGAFGVTPTVKAQTRTGETATEITRPDALYELHVIQYTQAGGLIGSINKTAGATTIGQKLSITLTRADDCQLVVFARGKGNSAPVPVVSGGLSSFQGLTMSGDIFKNIPTSGATQEEMNKMPYILHLPHVNVTSDGKLQSLTGAHDARLLLKRLAAKLTVNWKLSSALTADDYALKEVKLCQVPVDFRILPVTEETEWGTTYPSAVSEFGDTYRVTDAAGLAAGTKTVWVPANVRGSSAKATSPYYRTKENAPTAASYVEMVVDNSVKQERLYYRAYLGGKETTDFNLRENTDYDWTLTVNSANYRGDGRIQLLDQTPVTSTNIVNTSNCYMMKPGTNLCFNPYKHEAGKTCNGAKWNYQLVNVSGTSPSILSGKDIDKVKVLWQTKDNGTSGDLVMGYYVSPDNQANLVNITDPSDINNALVHVKVPVTNGGNAVIAAYHGNDIVWSWHLWITDYVPSRLSVVIGTADYNNAQQRSESGTVHKYRSDIWKTGIYSNMVMMDRDLGARKGGFPGIGKSAADYENYTAQDGVNRNGLIYQWGRKDPFFGSSDGTTDEINVIYDGDGVAVGLDAAVPVGTAMSGSANSLAYSIKHPKTFIKGASSALDWWDNTNGNGNSESGGAWLWNEGGGTAPGKKSLYDPSPEGWKVPMIGGSILNSSHFRPGADAGIYKGLEENNNGGVVYDANWQIVLNTTSNYFLYSRYYSVDHFLPKTEKTGTVGSGSNARGGRIFFLVEGIADDPSLWTIENTFWQPACAERYVSDGVLKNLQMGHVWTADNYNELAGLWAVKPALLQLGYYQRAYGWGVRCVQDNGN